MITTHRDAEHPVAAGTAVPARVVVLAQAASLDQVLTNLRNLIMGCSAGRAGVQVGGRAVEHAISTIDPTTTRCTNSSSSSAAAADDTPPPPAHSKP